MSGPATQAAVSDADLASAIIRAGADRGSPAAEAELYRRFGRRVRLYGRRRLRDASAVDNIVQRVMLVVGPSYARVRCKRQSASTRSCRAPRAS